MAIDRSIKLTTLPRPPGPTASENERTAWSVRVYRAITEITRAIQNIEGNQGALITPVLGGGGGDPIPACDPNYLRRDGTNEPTAEMDWDGFTIKDFGGWTSSKLALVSMIGNVPDGASIVNMETVWNVVKNSLDIDNDAAIHKWFHTDAGSAKILTGAMYANYARTGSTKTGPALVAVYDPAQSSALHFARIGIIDKADNAKFSGFEMTFQGIGIDFVVRNSLSFTIAGGGALSNLQNLRSDVTTNLGIQVSGFTGAGQVALRISRNAAFAGLSTQRMMAVQEKFTGSNTLLDRFSVWTDNAFGQGGAGIPEDQFFSLDDLDTVRGDTGFRYNSATSTVEFFVDGVVAWTASADGAFEGGDVALAVQLDEAAGSITYIGEAQPGTVTSAASWRVKRMDESGDPEIIILWADGNNDFDNIWDNRASLSYS